MCRLNKLQLVDMLSESVSTGQLNIYVAEYDVFFYITAVSDCKWKLNARTNDAITNIVATFSGYLLSEMMKKSSWSQKMSEVYSYKSASAEGNDSTIKQAELSSFH